VFIDGDSLKDYLIGIIVPDEIYLKEYCISQGITGSHEELCHNKVANLNLTQVKNIGQNFNFLLLSYFQSESGA
jgi:hypothetical protein